MAISIRLGDSLNNHDKVKLAKIGQAAIFCSATDRLFNTNFKGIKAQMIKNSGLEAAVSQTGFVTAINRNGGSHWLLAILSGNSEVAAICPIEKSAGCYGHPSIVFFREKALEICAWVNAEKEARSEKMKAKKERIMPVQVEETQPEQVAPVAPVAPIQKSAVVLPDASESESLEQTAGIWLAGIRNLRPDLRTIILNELLALQANEADQADLAIAG